MGKTKQKAPTETPESARRRKIEQELVALRADFTAMQQAFYTKLREAIDARLGVAVLRGREQHFTDIDSKLRDVERGFNDPIVAVPLSRIEAAIAALRAALPVLEDALPGDTFRIMPESSRALFSDFFTRRPGES